MSSFVTKFVLGAASLLAPLAFSAPSPKTVDSAPDRFVPERGYSGDLTLLRSPRLPSPAELDRVFSPAPTFTNASTVRIKDIGPLTLSNRGTSAGTLTFRPAPTEEDVRSAEREVEAARQKLEAARAKLEQLKLARSAEEQAKQKAPTP